MISGILTLSFLYLPSLHVFMSQICRAMPAHLQKRENTAQDARKWPL